MQRDRDRVEASHEEVREEPCEDHERRGEHFVRHPRPAPLPSERDVELARHASGEHLHRGVARRTRVVGPELEDGCPPDEDDGDVPIATESHSVPGPGVDLLLQHAVRPRRAVRGRFRPSRS